MKAILFLAILMSYNCIQAQDSATVIVKTGSRIKDVLPQKEMYLNAQFMNGEVIFRDHTKARAKMNYNCLYDQMLFIDVKGDTLAVKDEKDIHYISLGNDTFYYEQGYKKILESNGDVKIAEKRVWEVADIRKIGSHDRAANTYAVNSYKTVTDEFGRTLDLVLNEDIVLRKKPIFYLGNKFGRFVPANKKNLLLFFPKEQTRITEYLKEHKIDFSSKDDLVKLTRYLEEKS